MIKFLSIKKSNSRYLKASKSCGSGTSQIQSEGKRCIILISVINSLPPIGARPAWLLGSCHLPLQSSRKPFSLTRWCCGISFELPAVSAEQVMQPRCSGSGFISSGIGELLEREERFGSSPKILKICWFWRGGFSLSVVLIK